MFEYRKIRPLNMCGIWASVGWKVTREVINTVRRRGPDGDGWDESVVGAGPLALGHVRLAIYDTSTAGLQPFSTSDGSLSIVFNGAIFNYAEIRSELEEANFRFRTKTDTEVILASYLHWGIECLNRFNGMFAFVIVDHRSDQMLIVRDRFSIKPLYYYVDREGVGFASEIRQLLAADRIDAVVNWDTASNFLVSGLLDYSTDTLVKNIKQVPGGSFVQLDLKKPISSQSVRPQEWYTRPSLGSVDCDAEDAIAEFARIFEDAVAVRLPADVPVGIGLSGGIDSSAIAGVISKLSKNQSITAVSARYDDPRVDEGDYIESVHQQSRIDGYSVFPNPDDFMSRLDEISKSLDSPFASTSIFAQWAVFECGRENGLKVMLTGQGADEQLCGYLPMLNVMLATHLKSRNLRRYVDDFAGHMRRHNAPFFNTLLRSGGSLAPQSLIKILRTRLKVPWLREIYQDSNERIETYPFDIEPHIFAQMFSLSLPGLLHYQDRTSMANGIESREPFLDHRVVEFLVGLGGKYKVRNGETKWLLREAMKPVLSPLVHGRQSKIGFETPQDYWLRGAMREFMGSEIDIACERFGDMIQSDEIRSMKNEFKGGASHFGSTLWRLASLSNWSRLAGVA
jgi:asparagine synthase (glutamine-hydrolysing)